MAAPSELRLCSEHAMPDWIRRTALADILGADFDALEEDPLYLVLDKLHPHRSVIEAALVERERSLFNLDATIYLYDLTSTYFEGQCVRNAKAKRGYSRDHRPDCKQVVVGLVVRREGFPITHEVFAGNAQDRTTLATMLDRLTERAGLKQGSTVVVDRGMAFDDNIAEIKQRRLNDVVASRQPERDRWLGDFEDTEGFTPLLRQPSPLNGAQKKTSIEVKTAPKVTTPMCCAAASNASPRTAPSAPSRKAACAPTSRAIPAAGEIVCLAWAALLTSYRDLNRTKFAVLQQIEADLPIAPFTRERETYRRDRRRSPRTSSA